MLAHALVQVQAQQHAALSVLRNPVQDDDAQYCCVRHMDGLLRRVNQQAVLEQSDVELAPAATLMLTKLCETAR